MTMTTGAIMWFNGVIIFGPMLYKLLQDLAPHVIQLEKMILKI